MIAGRPMSSSAFERLRQRLDVMRARRREPDLGHRLAEQLAVLGLVDGVGGGADHLDVELVQHAHLAQRQRAVERGLPAHGREQRVGALLLDDLGDDLGRDRLDIGRVGQIRIGHDRRRIGIDQDDPVALVLQRLAGLGAGIVELAGLADDDRAGADDQDRFDVGSFGHRAPRSILVVPAASRPEIHQHSELRPERQMSGHIKKGRAFARPSPLAPGVPPRGRVFRPESEGREGEAARKPLDNSAPQLCAGRSSCQPEGSHLCPNRRRFQPPQPGFPAWLLLGAIALAARYERRAAPSKAARRGGPALRRAGISR